MAEGLGLNLHWTHEDPQLCEGCWRGEHWMIGEVWCQCCASEHRTARGLH